MFRLIFLVALLAQASAKETKKATTTKPKAKETTKSKATAKCNDKTPFLETVCTDPAPMWKQLPKTACPTTCGTAESKVDNVVTCVDLDGKTKIDDAKCTAKKPSSATQTTCAKTADCGTWKKTAGKCPAVKCGLPASTATDTYKCQVGGKDVADDKCKNKPTTKTECAKTAACGTWKKTAGSCPAVKCGLKASKATDTYKCQVGGKDATDDKCENKPTTQTDCKATTACTWKQVAGTCPKAACGLAESKVDNVPTCVDLDGTTKLAESKCKNNKPTPTKTTCPAQKSCKWKQLPKTACPTTCGTAESKVDNVVACVDLDGKTKIDDAKCSGKKPTATQTTCAKTADCGTWKKTAGKCPAVKCGLPASTATDTHKCQVGGKDVADDKCKNKPTTKTDCAKTDACGTWKKTAGKCPTACGLKASKATDTHKCQVGGKDAADDKCKDKPTTQTDCKATDACGTWKKTAGKCPAVKCGLKASKVADTHKCQVGGKDAADDKCENKPTTQTDCKATAACGTWKETAGKCPAGCGLKASKVANTQTCQVGGKDAADDKCENKPTTQKDCNPTAACTWKQIPKTACPKACGTAESKVDNVVTCVDLDGKTKLAEGKCTGTKPTATQTTCAKTAACTWAQIAAPCDKKCGQAGKKVDNTITCVGDDKKTKVAEDKCESAAKPKKATQTTCAKTAACPCEGFTSDNKCNACPEGYTCDGTGKVTKTKKTCAKGQVKTQKCFACPDKHTCDFKTGDAKTDGKSVKTTKPPVKTTKPPVKTKKLSNSNTLSVALPLCLTALIMFK